MVSNVIVQDYKHILEKLAKLCVSTVASATNDQLGLSLVDESHPETSQSLIVVNAVMFIPVGVGEVTSDIGDCLSDRWVTHVGHGVSLSGN